MKLQHIRLANSIRVGTDEVNFIDSKFTAELINDVTIKITNRKGNTSYTTLFNTIYFTEADEKPKQESKRSSQNNLK